MSWLRYQTALAPQDAAPQAYSLTGEAGSFAFTGQAANLLAGRLVEGGAGAFALTGQAATLTYTPLTPAFTLTGDAGSFALMGQNAGLRTARLAGGGAGSFVLTGQDATLTYVQGGNVQGNFFLFFDAVG